MTDVSKVLADIHPEEAIAEVVAYVEYLTGVSRGRILSRSRDRNTARARQMVMWKARQKGYSLTAIGRALNRDHTSVLHGIRVINRKLGL
jgi:chromosomal replication initiation ATPase DnaA